MVNNKSIVMSRLAKPMLMVFLLLLISVESKRKFCSVMCANRGCDGNTENDCNNRCSSNWIVAASSCTPDNSKNYYVVDTTNDLGGTLQVSPTDATSRTCDNFDTYPYSSGTANTAVVTLAGGISDTPGFYQVIAYFGIISVKVKQTGGGGGASATWDLYNNYFVDMVGGSFSQSNNYLMRGTTKVES